MSRPLSVVIPTKDRLPALEQTLAGLERQDGAGDFETIVVDNGSAPEAVAAARSRVEGSALDARFLDRPEGGPAAARNAGIAAARGDAILFLGDDTEPAGPGLLEAHARLHADRPEPGYAVLGRITWSPRAPVTPFMRWLEDGGPQFDYGSISAGPVDAATFFYSSHASVKKSLLDRVGGFDERFPGAAVEDTELGVRLAEAGLELDYHPELLVHHDHPTAPAQSLRRSIAVGRSAALYNRLRPDRPHPGVKAPEGPAWAALRTGAPLLGRVAELPLPGGIREGVWGAMTRAGYARGYRMGPEGGR